jgi:type I restriction enzyme M protein
LPDDLGKSWRLEASRLGVRYRGVNQLTEEQKRRLEQKLWDIANTLRGKMDADEFRDYILGFIFYKYLSEKMHRYANAILAEDNVEYLAVREGSEDGDAMLEAVRGEAVQQLGYFLKPAELFSEIAKRGNSKGGEGESSFILDDLQKILTSIEQSTMGTDSEDDFDKLFEDLDLTSTKLGRTEHAKNELIAKVLVHLDQIDFELEKADSDVLGDAYEYLIGQFASGAGKKAGEFYTPREVSTILARIVTTGKSRLKTIYDPTCGSGSLLLRVAREVEEVGHYYGQEMNRTTYNLARMNMLLHDIHYSRFDLRQEDTLTHPQLDLDMRFEAVVANPPFSANWSANDIFLADDRFSQYGRLAPSSKADFAFVQHMIHHLDDNGTMAVILPHGVLFRGGAEGHIRQYLIKDKNYLDAVIGLPANIFYGTSIPTSILVFKKCREHPDDILFIDASAYFEKVKNQNVLRECDIDRIIAAYRDRTETEKFSHRATMAEIAENDYNLNIPRYVDTFEEEEAVKLDLVLKELKVISCEMVKIDATIAGFCKELGLEAPL